MKENLNNQYVQISTAVSKCGQTTLPPYQHSVLYSNVSQGALSLSSHVTRGRWYSSQWLEDSKKQFLPLNSKYSLPMISWQFFFSFWSTRIIHYPVFLYIYPCPKAEGLEIIIKENFIQFRIYMLLPILLRLKVNFLSDSFITNIS